MDKSIPEYEIIDIKPNINSPEIKALVFHYLYKPTQKEIENRISEYTKNDKINIYGCIAENITTGIIVIKRSSPTAAEIVGIAVSPECRNLGLGRKMIEYVVENSRYETITAETDDDAVDFYKKCGFSITDLGYKYGNSRRYKCAFGK